MADEELIRDLKASTSAVPSEPAPIPAVETADIDIGCEEDPVLSEMRQCDPLMNNTGKVPESMEWTKQVTAKDNSPTCCEISTVISAGAPALSLSHSIVLPTKVPAKAAIFKHEGDPRMDGSTAVRSALPSSMTDRSTIGAVFGASDSDSDAEFLAEAATLAAYSMRRRSARIAASTTRRNSECIPAIEDCDETPTTGSFSWKSLFSSGRTDDARSEGPKSRSLAAILRERNQREKVQAYLEELRNDLLDNPDISLDNEEKVFADLADREHRMDAASTALYNKYYRPVPLFVAPPRFPKQKNELWTIPQQATHPLHDMLLATCSEGVNSSMVILPTMVKFLCKSGLPPPNFVADMLFYRIAYDPTEDTAGKFTREQEVHSLTAIIQHSTAPLNLPSMLEVLKSYGARFRPHNAKTTAFKEAAEESLDKRMVDNDGLAVDAKMAMRNLGRALRVWSAQVEAEMDLRNLFGQKQAKRSMLSETATYCLAIIQLCVQILLSPFGSRLKVPVARLIEAILDRVDVSEWCLFRQCTAKNVFGCTSRLGLHVELLTHLFPIRTTRSRHLGLDIGFLSLRQWHAGPGMNPIPSSIADVWPESAVAKGERLDISFSIADILYCMQSIPKFGKETDVAWACGIARILMQVTVESDVLATRKDGDIVRIQAIIKKMRVCFHRMSFSVPVQDMRLALDVILSALTGFID